jgi:hypothetical protein
MPCDVQMSVPKRGRAGAGVRAPARARVAIDGVSDHRKVMDKMDNNQMMTESKAAIPAELLGHLVAKLLQGEPLTLDDVVTALPLMRALLDREPSSPMSVIQQREVLGLMVLSALNARFRAEMIFAKAMGSSLQ